MQKNKKTIKLHIDKVHLATRDTFLYPFWYFIMLNMTPQHLH